MASEHEVINAWWASVPVLSVIGFWYKTRMDLRKEILAVEAKAAEAKQRAEEVRLELSECRLGIQKEFVTHKALQSVKDDIKADAREREERITNSIKGVHQRLDVFNKG